MSDYWGPWGSDFREVIHAKHFTTPGAAWQSCFNLRAQGIQAWRGLDRQPTRRDDLLTYQRMVYWRELVDDDPPEPAP